MLPMYILRIDLLYVPYRSGNCKMDKNEQREIARRELRSRTLDAAAAVTCSQGGGRGDIAKITHLLYHNDPLVREGAIKNLARLSLRELAPHIKQSLNDGDFRVRAAACCALGQMRAIAAKPKLYDALNDREPLVRCAAAVALADMGDKYGLSHVARLVCIKGKHQMEALQAFNQITRRKFPLTKKGIKQAIHWCRLQSKSLGIT
jgi:HEAT repeat protein